MHWPRYNVDLLGHPHRSTAVGFVLDAYALHFDLHRNSKTATTCMKRVSLQHRTKKKRMHVRGMASRNRDGHSAPPELISTQLIARADRTHNVQYTLHKRMGARPPREADQLAVAGSADSGRRPSNGKPHIVVIKDGDARLGLPRKPNLRRDASRRRDGGPRPRRRRRLLLGRHRWRRVPLRRRRGGAGRGLLGHAHPRLLGHTRYGGLGDARRRLDGRARHGCFRVGRPPTTDACERAAQRVAARRTPAVAPAAGGLGASPAADPP
ncbi:hypothetical protein BU14_0014s0041 [Porphyra umbilicalis]|uniref:Uncharacterized protein n=1 Tax=Porphyra umbilicalis TaxID=2786 RepID=A0A1X6PL10_PORUM|nr:hypothetical protein BU14_0014s0041 [Porphyra umbilicalis]|eukprot:OSX81490.1 hypothetical protein BU14_0014s0041 [Porphyra umbilicalis]